MIKTKKAFDTWLRLKQKLKIAAKINTTPVVLHVALKCVYQLQMMELKFRSRNSSPSYDPALAIKADGVKSLIWFESFSFSLHSNVNNKHNNEPMEFRLQQENGLMPHDVKWKD